MNTTCFNSVTLCRKLTLYFICIIMTMGLLPVGVYSASFECSESRTQIEKAICADSELYNLDDLLLRTYKKALANSSYPEILMKQQHTWLHEIRNKCRDTACLKKVYKEQINILTSLRPREEKNTRIEQVKLDYYVGVYSIPSPECWTFAKHPDKEMEGGGFIPCSVTTTDCIKIEKISDTKAKIIIFSIQGNLHMCYASGIAELKGNTLELFDTERADDETDQQGIKIILDKSRIIFKNINYKDQPAPFCAYRANLEDIEFPLVSRKYNENSCGSGDN